MSLALAVGACIGLAVVSTVVSVAREGRPGRQRSHGFEDDDGDRANPFAAFSAGADAADTACRDCGAPLESETYRYCGGCAPGAVADD
jgi:hypothetical protein